MVRSRQEGLQLTATTLAPANRQTLVTRSYVYLEAAVAELRYFDSGFEAS